MSTMNSRMFEFGAVLFIASVFPGTLLPASIYAMVRGLAAVGLGRAVGKFLDGSERLQVVRVSISRFHPRFSQSLL